MPTTVPAASDELSISQPGSLLANDGTYERFALSLRSSSHWNVTDDGDVHATSHARLRFQYSFEAADGTKIAIRAEANLNYGRWSDDDSQQESIKLRARASIQVLQEDVATGTAPLLDGSGLSDDARQAISQALDLFQQVTDTISSLFQESTPADGDNLISGLVDAFNGLADSIGSILIPSTGNPDAIPSEEAGQVAALPTATREVVTPEPASLETVAATEGDTGAVPEEAASSTSPASEEVASADPAEISATDSQVPAETGQGESAAPVVSEPTQPSARTVLLQVRLKVVQSLRSLVGVFDSDSSNLVMAQSTLRASVQYAARYSLIDAAVQDSTIDAQA